METIYWIQRLEYINLIAWITFGLGITTIITFTIISSIEISDTYSETDEQKWRDRRRKGLKHGALTVAISMLIGIFVPTTSELYAIYGIGGTIDYIKSNDTAKQLPDKVINALDAWVDKQITDNDKENK